MPCQARKYIAYISETEADIYHYGQHNCTAKSTFVWPTSVVSEAMTYDFNVKPSKIQSNTIISKLCNRDSWDNVQNTVKEMASLRKISNDKIKIKTSLQPLEGFSAVHELKAYTDVKDKLLIYKIDENDQFVFKSSTSQMKIAANLDNDGTHFMAEEFCNFDGNHKRTLNFVTMTASTY